MDYTKFGIITGVFMILYTFGNIAQASIYRPKPTVTRRGPRGRHARIDLH